MLFMIWKVTSAEGIFPFVLALTFIYFFSHYSKLKIRIENVILVILLIIFSVTHYHPQWFIWLTPLLVLNLVATNFKHALLVATLFLSWLFIVFTFEPSLSYGLFSPIFPSLADANISLTNLILNYSDPNQVKSIVRSVFAGAAAFYSYELLKPAKDA